MGVTGTRLTVRMQVGPRKNRVLLGTWEHLTGWGVTTQRSIPAPHGAAGAGPAAARGNADTSRPPQPLLPPAVQGAQAGPERAGVPAAPQDSAHAAPRAASRASVIKHLATKPEPLTRQPGCTLCYDGTQFTAVKLSVPCLRSSLGIALQRLCAHPQLRAVKQPAAAAVQDSCWSGRSQQGTLGHRMGPERNLPGNTFLTCPHHMGTCTGMHAGTWCRLCCWLIQWDLSLSLFQKFRGLSVHNQLPIPSVNPAEQSQVTLYPQGKI